MGEEGIDGGVEAADGGGVYGHGEMSEEGIDSGDEADESQSEGDALLEENRSDIELTDGDEPEL